MRILSFILLCLWYGGYTFAQVKDRYLEITHDTLACEKLGANFLRSLFSSTPHAFFMNRDCENKGQAWEIRQWGDSAEFIAVKGKNFLSHSSTDSLYAITFRATTDIELYTLLGKLFRQAILLAEDTDGHFFGLDGNTYYFTSTDTDGKRTTAQKWTPEVGSLCRELVDLGDSIYHRIVRKENEWEPIRQTTSFLLAKLNKEPLSTTRCPVYQGIWRLGLQPSTEIELSEEPVFPIDVTDYLYTYMNYPSDMLAANRGGYAVCQFTIDTLGLPKNILTLESSEPACEKEVKRLIAEMPHWLPARDAAGNRVECNYAVHVSFRPQRYFTRLKRDAVWEQLKNTMFIEYDLQPEFPGGRSACAKFIETHTHYPSSYIGSGKNLQVHVSFVLNSYGEPTEFEIVRSSGIPAFDREALHVVRSLPRWKPARRHYPGPQFVHCKFLIPVKFTDPKK